MYRALIGVSVKMDAVAIFAVGDHVGPAELPLDDALIHVLFG
jgi:hypothetical protein